MNRLKILFWLVDTGFIAYWIVTLLGAIPAQYLFKDYHDPILMAWNCSFLPLDLLISLTGFRAIRLSSTGDPQWRAWALVSLVLTSTSGLMAISFWLIRLDFDLWWWIPNGFLMLYPLFFIPRLMPSHQRASARPDHESVRQGP
jgi:hypothetical protein